MKKAGRKKILTERHKVVVALPLDKKVQLKLIAATKKASVQSILETLIDNYINFEKAAG